MLYSPRFGLSVCGRPDASPRDIIAAMRDNGLTAVELNKNYLERFETEVSLFADEKITLGFHLPADGDYAALRQNEAEDDRRFDNLRRLMDRAAGAGCSVFTMHMQNVCGQKLEEYWDRSVNFARRLGRAADGLGALLGVENCFPVVRTGAIAKRFLDDVGMNSVGLTLDTGHFWSALCEDEVGEHKANPDKCTPRGNEILNSMCLEMARLVGDRIHNIHIHNVRASDWADHLSVPDGVMRFGPLFDILRETGYAKSVIMELRPTGDWSAIDAGGSFLRQYFPAEYSRA